MPHRSSTADSRQQQAVKAERVRKILQGIIRDDSDDELGNEDHPWEWIHENVDREADGDEENEDEEEKHAAARRRRSRPGRYSPRKEKIIGAKMGKFECKIGDCVLLKAEGTNAAWVGIICEFTENKEQEKLAKFMCKSPEPQMIFGFTVSHPAQGSAPRRRSRTSRRKGQISFQ
jgi:origin recognition complex subunit 1